MSTAEVVSYLHWKKDVAEHDYAAASSYLSIRFGERRAEMIAAELRKLPVITRRANDVMRATGRTPLPLSDPGVLKDLQKVLSRGKAIPNTRGRGRHRGRLPPALPRLRPRPLRRGPAQARRSRRPVNGRGRLRQSLPDGADSQRYLSLQVPGRVVARYWQAGPSRSRRNWAAS